MKTQRSADIAVGWFIALLGLFVLYASTMIRVRGVQRLSPRTFPYVVGSLHFVLRYRTRRQILAFPGRGHQAQLAGPRRDKVILVNLVSLAFYIILMNPLGLPLSTFLYVTFTIWYLKRSKWVTAIVIGLIFGIISYYVFISLLGLSFPEGFLLEG